MDTSMKNITLCYGPNEALGVFKRHRQRLSRLIAALTSLGFHTETEKIHQRDRLVIKLNGEEIFRCRLSYLQYKPDRKEDETLRRAIYAAIEASARFKLARESIRDCSSFDN